MNGDFTDPVIGFRYSSADAALLLIRCAPTFAFHDGSQASIQLPLLANAVEKHSVWADQCSGERLAEGRSVNEDAVLVLATVFFANSHCHAGHFWFC
jgi:hypothetical protein